MTGFHRRQVILTGLSLFATPALAAPNPDKAFKQIEARLGGRVGLSALDTGSGKTLSWRADERFAMCSSFKWVLAAAISARADQGQIKLDQMISCATAAALLPHSPITAYRMRKAGAEVRIEDLCAAAVEESDNAAANLLLAKSGRAQTSHRLSARVGDTITRLDRNEPSF